MVKFVPLGISFLAVLAYGTYRHGCYTDRFSPAQSEKLDTFTECVQELPLEFGDWVGTETKIPDKQFKLTNCTAYQSASFENRTTGDVVSTYIVSGTGRHITIHSPDWCYQGAGYDMQGKPVQFTMDVPGVEANPEFLTAVFRKEDIANPMATQELRIFWTYSNDGKWIGPDMAKMYYSGVPALYKIYLICNVTGRDSDAEASTANQFAQEVLPEINRILFRKATAEATDAAATGESGASAPSSELMDDLGIE